MVNIPQGFVVCFAFCCFSVEKWEQDSDDIITEMSSDRTG